MNDQDNAIMVWLPSHGSGVLHRGTTSIGQDSMKNKYPFMGMMLIGALMNSFTMALTFYAWYLNGFDMIGVGLLMMVGASSYGQSSAYLDWKKSQEEFNQFKKAREAMPRKPLWD